MYNFGGHFMTLKRKLLSILIIAFSVICLAGCAIDLGGLGGGGGTGGGADSDGSGSTCTHSWQDATCTSPKTCSLCKETVGSANGHTPEADDGDCTTAAKCADCGKIITAAKPTHAGGTATCTELAECSTCGKSYGEYALHSGEVIWIKRLNTHYKAHSCCFERVGEDEGHTKVGGVCTVCGFKPTVSVGEVEAVAGNTVTVSVLVTDNPGILGLELEIKYNGEFLTLTDISAGDALSTLTFSKSDSLDSGTKVLFDGAEISDADIKDGEIINLTFEISEDAPSGDYIVIATPKAFDNDLNSINFALQSGNITVNND
jgi:hypothetical protein